MPKKLIALTTEGGNEIALLDVGDWIEVYGIEFQLVGLKLAHDKPPVVEFMSLIELAEKQPRTSGTR